MLIYKKKCFNLPRKYWLLKNMEIQHKRIIYVLVITYKKSKTE